MSGRIVKMRLECFLNDEEKAEVQEYIKKLLKEGRKTEFYESGGLGVRAEWFEDCVMFDVYRIVGTTTVKIAKKKRGGK